MRKLKSGGGWQAIWYTWRKGREAGGIWKLWKAMRTKNACKTCALGMGGQLGGMVNEAGHFPEVCKKSLQAMVADMQGAIQADFFSTYSIAQLQQFTPRELEACGRITQPLVHHAGENYYRPISWDEAVATIVAKLKAVAPSETFWYFSGRSSNEAGFLLQLFARLYGTNNVNNCSYYCHQASGVGLAGVLGSGVATVQLHDVENSDLVLLIGGNPASNHPRLMRSLMTVRRRGGQVIVVNPVVETGLVNFKVPSDVRSLLFGTEIASLYLQPHIGGDLALITGIAKRIEEIGAHSEQFLNDHCEGWPELRERLRAISWKEIVDKSGVTRDHINEVARRYATAKNVIFAWTMGITHHLHGVENVQAIANLALMRGMIGKPNSGLLPIRGHSNVQGIGTVGVTPKLKDAVLERLQSHFGVKLPTEPGLDTMACMDAATNGQVKFGWCLGGNLYGSNPDATYARNALSKLDLLVYLNTTLNTGHASGLAQETIILPVLARDEEPEPTTQESMFSYVRISDGGQRRHAGPRSEIQIVADLAHRVLANSTPIDWQSMEYASRIRESIGRIVPGLEAMGEIDRTKQEFQIPGRTFHEPKFPTPNGKARLFTHELPDPSGHASPSLQSPSADGDREKSIPLRLMTVRSEGQFNTVVYEDYDLYRNVERRDVILMHPDDIARLRLESEQRVTVRSEVGSMDNILLRAFPEIRAGNALMYYPEANVLVPRTLDPQSKTPAFKNVLVMISPMVAAPHPLTSDAPVNGSGQVEQAISTAPGHNTRDKMRAC
ncbi:MAG: FdhF/YdeP family oxidoreductase [Pirellulales bacterium]|nr:FdhF/YdeP family oxidoreductase [Pirellulales bacterium]